MPADDAPSFFAAAREIVSPPRTAPKGSILIGPDARVLIKGLAYGHELQQAQAGVRMALSRYRKAQRIARSQGAPVGVLSPASARGWVRREIARVRAVQAKMAAPSPSFPRLALKPEPGERYEVRT